MSYVANIPTGWVIVPEEPTEAMKIAGDCALVSGSPNTQSIWRTLLAAVEVPDEPSDLPDPASLPIGTDLHSLVNQYLASRAQRLAKEKEAKVMEANEVMLKKAIIAKAKEQELAVIGTNLGTVKITYRDVPKATVWPEVWQYIVEHNAFDILHRRLTDTAIRDRIAAGETIPGITFTPVASVSVGKP